MRNLIALLALIGLITSISVLSCNDSGQDAQTTAIATTDSTKINDSTNTEYMKDIESYKRQITDTIDANIKSIAGFKIKIAHDKDHAKAFYDEKIEALEKGNAEMKKKIVEYKAEGKEKWEEFKKEFNNGMDTLGKAVKNLVSKG